jgi:hypothetical protein
VVNRRLVGLATAKRVEFIVHIFRMNGPCDRVNQYHRHYIFSRISIRPNMLAKPYNRLKTVQIHTMQDTSGTEKAMNSDDLFKYLRFA